MPINRPNVTEGENQTKGEKHNVLCIKCNFETEHVAIISFDIDADEPVEEPFSGRQCVIRWAEHYHPLSAHSGFIFPEFPGGDKSGAVVLGG